MIDVDSIKCNVPLSEILTKWGCQVPSRRKYRIPCPLHNGADRNFAVDEDIGLFHCFVCGKGGSVIDLVSELHKISVKDAIKLLVEYADPYDALRIDARSVMRRLEKKEKVPALEVPFELRSLPVGYRDISRSAIDHFGLALCDEGVFIPHYGLDGKLMSYAIRQPDGVKPKYKNNPGYNRDVPFGLYKNQNEITNRGFVIVCEGQFDAIALWDRGFKNVVSLGGDHMSDTQAHLLLSVTPNMTVMMDGDKAGWEAAARIWNKWHTVFNMKLFYLDGKDPEEFIRELGDSVSID